MRREVQGAILLVMGVVFAHLVLSGAYLNYVKGSLLVPLIGTTLVLLTLGALSLVRDHEDELVDVEPGAGEFPACEVAATDPREADAHGHDHSHAPRIGLLMLAPLLCLLLIAPAPLGSYAAERGGSNRLSEPQVELGELPPADEQGAVPLTLADTVVRSLFDADGPMTGTPVRLVGFVAEDDALAGYRLSRFSVACCAADATVRQVVISGGRTDLGEDTWVEVVARFDGHVQRPDGEPDSTGLPVLEVLSEEVIDPPRSPYEY
jgi:uncharacterized repeat protein (TIGR03943 family)